MSKIAGKLKDKLKGATDKTKETVVGSKDTEETGYDSTKQYEANEPMSAAKIKEHESTAVKREMTEKITDKQGTTSNSEEAKEKARRSGMTKGTAGA
jgi:hypothetical protein